MSSTTQSGEGGHSIFLSYSRVDRAQVLPLIDVLEKNGFTVWWDGLLKGGDQFLQVTENALETADTVLVVWTKTSIQSDWVRDEATRGRERKCLLSVSFDGSFPPLGFRQSQVIDLTQQGQSPEDFDFSEVIAALSDSDRNVPRAAVEKANAPLRASGMDRRTLLLAGGAGVIAIGGAGAAWQSGMFSAASLPDSIAVMTFENLSNDPDQSYFSAGLSEELRSILSINPQLSVAAQTSSDKFSAQEATASAIASALGVAHVLEGSVRREGNRLRVAARLIDGTNDLDVWSDTFDRELSDVLTVQSEIATAVVDSMIANIAGERAAVVRLGGTENPEALDAYLHAIADYGSALGRESVDRDALAQLDRAIELDPEYGAAHALRSRILTSIGNRYASTKDELQSYYSQAMDAARQAITTAPDLAEGHSALGAAFANGQLDIAAATRPYERSYELGYGNARVLTGYTLFASYVGDFERGRKAIERATRLDPLNSPVFRAEAFLEFAARDYDRATSAARRAISLNEDVSIARGILADIARFEGKIEEARDLYADEPSEFFRLPGFAMLERQAGNMSASQDAFDSMVSKFGDNSLYQQAQVLAQWGDSDAAMEKLESAYGIGDSGLVLSRSDRNLDPIRQTPDFRSLQRRLGFE